MKGQEEILNLTLIIWVCPCILQTKILLNASIPVINLQVIGSQIKIAKLENLFQDQQILLSFLIKRQKVQVLIKITCNCETKVTSSIFQAFTIQLITFRLLGMPCMIRILSNWGIKTLWLKRKIHSDKAFKK